MIAAVPAALAWRRIVLAIGAAALLALIASLYLLDDTAAPTGAVFTGLTLVAGAAAVSLVADRWRHPGTAWIAYGLYFAALLLVWRVHPTPEAGAEVERQLMFLVAIGATAILSTSPQLGSWLVAAHVIGLSLVLFQIPGPRSGFDHLGRPAFYHALQQWSGYPEIGLLMAMGGSAAAALALAWSAWRLRLAAAVMAGAFAVSTMFLMSRSAVITIAGAVAWLATAAFLKWRSRVAMAGAIVLMLATAWFTVKGPGAATAFERVSAGVSRETGIRSLGWRTGATMFREHPWVGVGLGRYPADYTRRGVGPDSTHAYNIVVHVAAETGMAGLVPYLVLWGRVLWLSLREASRRGAGPAAFAVHGMLVAFFLRSQSEHFLANLATSFRLLILLGVLFGLAEGLAALRSRREAPAGGARPPMTTA